MPRGLLCLAALALLVACGGGRRRRPERLVLYCVVPNEWCELVARRFQKDTGYRVAMTHHSSGETLALVRAERRSPKGDVWFGGPADGHLQAAVEKLIEPYRPRRLDELHSWARLTPRAPAYVATGLYRGVLGLGVNTEWLARRSLPVPTSWAELTHPRYRGEIQMANPNSSGTAYTALVTLVQLFGEDRAFEYLRALDRNVNQYTASGSAPVRAAARGETGIGIVFLHDATTERLSGAPILEVVPAEGTGYEVGAVSVIRGARHPGVAQRFVEWALSARAQELAVRAHAYHWPSNRAARPPPARVRPDQARLIDYDLERYSQRAVRERLLRRWDAEVRAGPS